MLWWKRMKRFRSEILFFICGVCIVMCACTNEHHAESGTRDIVSGGNVDNNGQDYANDRNAETDTHIMNITSEIEEYIQRFVSLYTSNAHEDTECQMIIEERELLAGNENNGVIIKYSDLSGHCLRYELHYYGETGNRTVNYYLCENFYWVSNQVNYYSSWILNPEYSNVLYSEVDNWIVMDENVYSMHDSGRLEKIPKMPSEILLLKDIEECFQKSCNSIQTELERQSDIVEDQSISFEGFGDMDYALFLETNVGYGVTLDYFKYGIYGDFVNTVREGEEVYFQLCKTMLGTEISWKIHEDWARNMEILHIQNLSPDLQWIAARQYLKEAVSGFYKDEVFYNGDMIAEVESSSDVTDTYFYFKGTEQGTYEPVSDTLFEKRAQLVEELGGYTNACYLEDVTCLDEYGKYLAISAPDSQSIGIYSTEDWGLKRYISMEHIDMEYPIAVSQLVGDESSGWLVFSNGGSTYRLDYPGGKPEKIGEFMFDTTYSPDGKYLAYCTGNMEFHEFSKELGDDEQKQEKIGKLYHEWDEIPPGWYIREIETGNTVYIPIATWEQDDRPLYGGRCIWIEKDKLFEVLDL